MAFQEQIISMSTKSFSRTDLKFEEHKWVDVEAFVIDRMMCSTDNSSLFPNDQPKNGFNRIRFVLLEWELLTAF